MCRCSIHRHEKTRGSTRLRSVQNRRSKVHPHPSFHLPFLTLITRAIAFRYQNWIRMVIWLFFLFVYSQSVQQPLETQMDPSFDAWEVVLYTMGLAYTIE